MGSKTTKNFADFFLRSKMFEMFDFFFENPHFFGGFLSICLISLSVELFIRIPPLFQKCRKQGGNSYNVVSGSKITNFFQLWRALEPIFFAPAAFFGSFLAFSERLTALYTQNFRACGAKSSRLSPIRPGLRAVWWRWVKSVENKGGILITGGILMNNWTDLSRKFQRI